MEIQVKAIFNIQLKLYKFCKIIQIVQINIYPYILIIVRAVIIKNFVKSLTHFRLIKNHIFIININTVHYIQKVILAHVHININSQVM